MGEPVQFIPAEQLKRPIQFADGQVILSGWSDGSPSVKDIKSFEEFSKSLYDMAIDYNQALLRYLIDQGITLSAYQQRSTKPSDQENKFSESGDKHSLQSLDVIGSETTALADVILPKAGEALSTPGQTSTGGIEGKPAEPSSQLIGRDSPGAL